MPLKTLRQYFGYPNFRSGQDQVIACILRRQDCLVVLPTGGGKSLCFQIPGLIMAGTTVVISPLISLMKDQVDSLARRGISATYINSSLSKTEIKNRLSLFAQGKYKFVYVAPERLTVKEFIEVSQKVTISVVAVDEAHCVSMWGHDFRPEYRQIRDYVDQLMARPVVTALTATATTQVKNDIISSLRMKSPVIFQKSFYRPNLKFHQFPTTSSLDQETSLLALLDKHHHQTGIIYTLTRNSAHQICQLINKFWPEKNCLPYHGGLDSQTRSSVQDQFLHDQTQLIVATNAFGMGVDKPNVRFVIHYHLPSTLENYYQEAGRAGRDGQPAACYLLFNPQNLNLNLSLLSTQPPQNKIELTKLKQMIKYATSQTCLNKQILNYFAEKTQSQCQNCSHCCQDEILPSLPTQDRLRQLDQIRQLLAQEHHILPTQVMSPNLVWWLALAKPQNRADYLKIPGVGAGWLDQWYNSLSQLLERNQYDDQTIS